MKAEVGAGFAPLLVFVDVFPGDDIFELYMPATLGAKINVLLREVDEDGRLGVKFGVSHNSITGTGFGGGADYQFGREPTIVLSGGLMLYPDAEEKLRKRINKDKGTAFTEDNFSAPLAMVSPFLAVSLLFR